MPEFYTYNRTSLPNDRYAIDYALRDPDEAIAGKSVIKIINKKDNKLIKSLSIDGEIKTMCSIASKGLLAVVPEGSKQVFIYNPNEDKPVYTLTLVGCVSGLLTTKGSLVVSASGSLHFFNVHTFDLYKTIKLGDFIISMAASDQFMIFDVWNKKKTETVSQAMMYDSDGVFICNLGGPRAKKTTLRSSSVGILDNKYIFVAIPNDHTTYSIYVYHSKTEQQINLIEFKHSAHHLFICSLLYGGIGIYQDNGSSKTVSVIYDVLGPHVSLLSDTDIILLSREDMVLFISEKEREKVPNLVKNIVSALNTMGCFPRPIEQLITGYSVSRQALDEKELDQLITKFTPLIRGQ